MTRWSSPAVGTCGGRSTAPTGDGGGPAWWPCPPHPQYGGHRSDERLRGVAAALGDRDVDCLRIDYGLWDEGTGERTDVRNAVGWARDRYGRVGLFGYSFGGGVALVAAADSAARTTPVDAVAALAPVATLPDGTDVAAAVGRVEAPCHVSYGSRDRTVDHGDVVTAARAVGADVREWRATHQFVGRSGAVGGAIGAFLAGALG